MWQFPCLCPSVGNEEDKERLYCQWYGNQEDVEGILQNDIALERE